MYLKIWLSLLLLGSCLARDCPIWKPTPTEVMEHAQIVLHGRDVTSEKDCNNCPRTKMLLEVHCVLKGDSYPIPGNITIRYGDTCSETSLEGEKWNKTWIVALDRDRSRTPKGADFFWAEAGKGGAAVMTPDDDHLDAARSACGMLPWSHPNTTINTTCPTPAKPEDRKICKDTVCPSMWVSCSGKCFKISNQLGSKEDAIHECGDTCLAKFDEKTWETVGRHLPTDDELEWWTGVEEDDDEFVWECEDMEKKIEWFPWVSGEPKKDGKYVVVEDKEGMKTLTKDEAEDASLGPICMQMDAPFSPAMPNATQKFDDQLFGLHFMTEAWNGSICCLTVNESAGNLSLCSKNNSAQVKPVHLRTSPHLKLMDDADDMYLVVIVENHNISSPMPSINMMMYNVEKDDEMVSSKTKLSYRGPVVLQNETRVMTALLYKQPDDMEDFDLKPYSCESCKDDGYRCKFQLERFVADHELELHDAIYLNVTRDDFSANHCVENGDMQEHKVCTSFYPGTKVEDEKLKCGDSQPSSALRLTSYGITLTATVAMILTVW